MWSSVSNCDHILLKPNLQVISEETACFTNYLHQSFVLPFQHVLPTQNEYPLILTSKMVYKVTQQPELVLTTSPYSINYVKGI